MLSHFLYTICFSFGLLLQGACSIAAPKNDFSVLTWNVEWGWQRRNHNNVKVELRSNDSSILFLQEMTGYMYNALSNAPHKWGQVFDTRHSIKPNSNRMVFLSKSDTEGIASEINVKYLKTLNGHLDYDWLHGGFFFDKGRPYQVIVGPQYTFVNLHAPHDKSNKGGQATSPQILLRDIETAVNHKKPALAKKIRNTEIVVGGDWNEAGFHFANRNNRWPTFFGKMLTPSDPVNSCVAHNGQLLQIDFILSSLPKVRQQKGSTMPTQRYSDHEWVKVRLQKNSSSSSSGRPAPAPRPFVNPGAGQVFPNPHSHTGLNYLGSASRALEYELKPNVWKRYSQDDSGKLLAEVDTGLYNFKETVAQNYRGNFDFNGFVRGTPNFGTVIGGAQFSIYRRIRMVLVGCNWQFSDRNGNWYNFESWSMPMLNEIVKGGNWNTNQKFNVAHNVFVQFNLMPLLLNQGYGVQFGKDGNQRDIRCRP